MIERLLKREDLEQQIPFLKEKDIEWLQIHAKHQSYKNKECIIPFGPKSKFFFFILSGNVRGYDINDRGEERTFFIPPTHSFFSSPEILHQQKTTKYSFEAVGDCTLLAIPFEKLKASIPLLPSLAQLYILSLEQLVNTLIYRVEILAGKGPEERYDLLIQQNPQIFLVAPHKYISNYLGITPNSLSRIINRKKHSKS